MVNLSDLEAKRIYASFYNSISVVKSHFHIFLLSVKIRSVESVLPGVKLGKFNILMGHYKKDLDLALVNGQSQGRLVFSMVTYCM